jgi:hypothetical protein
VTSAVDTRSFAKSIWTRLLLSSRAPPLAPAIACICISHHASCHHTYKFIGIPFTVTSTPLSFKVDDEMRLFLHLTLGICIVAWQILFAGAVIQGIRPISGMRQLRARQESSGTTDVQWDSTSFIVKGQRVYGWSAEFHFWRLPVSAHVFPSLWPRLAEG